MDGLVGSISIGTMIYCKNFEHLEPKIADMDSLIWPELLQVCFPKNCFGISGQGNHPSSYGLNPDFDCQCRC